MIAILRFSFLIFLLLGISDGFTQSLQGKNGRAQAPTPAAAFQDLKDWTEKQVLWRFGTPSGRMDDGEDVQLLYTNLTVRLRNARVVSWHVIDVVAAQADRDLADQLQKERMTRLTQEQMQAEAERKRLAEEPEPEPAPGTQKPAAAAVNQVPKVLTGDPYSSSAHQGVLMQNLTEVQSGRKVILPNVDPRTGILSGSDSYKAVTREAFEKYGASQLMYMNAEQTRDAEATAARARYGESGTGAYHLQSSTNHVHGAHGPQERPSGPLTNNFPRPK